MSYLNQSRLAEDHFILRRATACAASEHIESPDMWVNQHRWQLSAQPGWVAAYASAQIAHVADPENVPEPGANEAAITDGMILAAVQLLATGEDPGTEELPEPEPEPEEPEE